MTITEVKGENLNPSKILQKLIVKTRIYVLLPYCDLCTNWDLNKVDRNTVSVHRIIIKNSVHGFGTYITEIQRNTSNAQIYIVALVLLFTSEVKCTNMHSSVTPSTALQVISRLHPHTGI